MTAIDPRSSSEVVCVVSAFFFKQRSFLQRALTLRYFFVTLGIFHSTWHDAPEAILVTTSSNFGGYSQSQVRKKEYFPPTSSLIKKIMSTLNCYGNEITKLFHKFINKVYLHTGNASICRAHVAKNSGIFSALQLHLLAFYVHVVYENTLSWNLSSGHGFQLKQVFQPSNALMRCHQPSRKFNQNNLSLKGIRATAEFEPEPITIDNSTGKKIHL